MKQLKQRSCALALLLSITVLLSGCDSGTGAVTSTAATSQPKQVEEVESTPAPQETESTADAQETTSTPSAADPEAAYCDVLDMIYTSISCGWTNCENDGSGNVSELQEHTYVSVMASGWGEYSLSELGYQFLDLNNDGQPELLFSSLDSAESGNFADLYTIVNGEITHPICVGGRERYTLAEDYSINCTWYTSSHESFFANYQFNNTENPLELTLYLDYDEGDEYSSPSYRYSTVAECPEDHLTSISKAEADTMLNNLPKNIPLELTPFSEYTPTTSNP